MMRALLFLLLALAPLIYCFRCYETTSLDKRSSLDSSTNTRSCSSQCYKITKTSPMYMATYGCDSSKSFCADIPSGKCKTVSGMKTCCCSSELCNSTGLITNILPLLISLVVSFIV